MQSPFPGMDPYLERHWGDIHQALITYARDQLQAGLPADLRARLQERLAIAVPEGKAHLFLPGVSVAERPRPRGDGGGLAVAEEVEVAVAEPLVLLVQDRRREGFIQVVEAPRGGPERVVTVIEFLGPSNKAPGRDRDAYLRKLGDLDAAGINLVEIDLLRAGRREMVKPVGPIPASHLTPYRVVARRSWGPDAVELYRVPLRARLPKVRVPLRPADADAVLDLQPLIDLAYRNGRYGDTDYRAEPDPPLDPEDAAWSDALLRERGRR